MSETQKTIITEHPPTLADTVARKATGATAVVAGIGLAAVAAAPVVAIAGAAAVGVGLWRICTPSKGIKTKTVTLDNLDEVPGNPPDQK